MRNSYANQAGQCYYCGSTLTDCQYQETTMAQELKPGEQVTVNREVPFSRQSGAYKVGIKQVNPGDIGEVVGPAEGRALTVRFNGIETVVSKQSLTRLGEAPVQKEKPMARKQVKGKPTSGGALKAAVQAVEKTP